MFHKRDMGAELSSKPGQYSDQIKIGEPHTFGDYEAAYRQNSATADRFSYGSTQLQFGVKLVEDVDPGPLQGQMYVTTDAGKRLYFTQNGQLRPDANSIISQGSGYGNGPAVSITGTPLNPQYHMFYAEGGDQHTGNQWTPIQINSTQDIMQAMQSGNAGRSLNQKYANMYGQASINPFGSKEGADIWTNADNFGRALSGVISQLVIPVAEMGLDTFTAGLASPFLAATGANKAMQGAIDNLMKNSKGKSYQSASNFDPLISNIIKDPRLPVYLQQQQDQSHAFIAKYGPQDYGATQKLAQETPMQQITKAKQLHQENEDMWVQSQVQEMQDTSDQIQKLLGEKTDATPAELAATPLSPIFQNIKTGLSLASTNQQKMNVINHFSKQIKEQLLPLLNIQHPDDAPTQTGAPVDPQKSSTLTASAQPGHPVLSINGTDMSHPGNTTITGTPGAIPPVVPG